MEWWQSLLFFWGFAAFLTRVDDMQNILTENRAWYDKILSSFMYWIMGWAWIYEDVILPTVNMSIFWWRDLQKQRLRN